MSSTPSLAAALAAFQADMPVVPKSKSATVKSDRGSYTYTYAGLAEVSAAAAPLLSAHGLSFSCVPTVDEHGHIMLAGVLMHESGEQVTGSLPISGGTPQQVGSALTYARRYLLGCMTGIVTDDDDDGAAASRKARKADAAPAGPTTTVRRKASSGRPVEDVPLPEAPPTGTPGPGHPPDYWQPDPWASQPPGVAPAGVSAPTGPRQEPHAPQVAPTAPDSEAVGSGLSDGLRRGLMSATSRVGIDPTTDRDMRLALWSALMARRITTANDLTRAEALTLMRRLNDVETRAVEWDYSVETGAVTLRHVDRELPL